MANPGAARVRRRYPAEQARQRILEAARRRLTETGPDGLRLQEIAADLGISHPAILHHFGSREGLLRELAAHCVARLNAEIAARIRSGGTDLAEILTLTRETLASQGQARLIAWLALSGRLEAGGGGRVLRDLVSVAHERREALRGERGAPAPDPDDTAHAVLLLALALFADALVGDVLRAGVGLEDEQGAARFRAWLAELLGSHLAGDAPERASQ